MQLINIQHYKRHKKETESRFSVIPACSQEKCNTISRDSGSEKRAAGGARRNALPAERSRARDRLFASWITAVGKASPDTGIWKIGRFYDPVVRKIRTRFIGCFGREKPSGILDAGYTFLPLSGKAGKAAWKPPAD